MQSQSLSSISQKCAWDSVGPSSLHQESNSLDNTVLTSSAEEWDLLLFS